VLHEIGHNWDEGGENDTVEDFRAISGWDSDEGLAELPNYQLSGDGDWAHYTNAEFTRNYGRTNPREDFAECFGIYWLHQLGEQSAMAVNQFDDLPLKMGYMGDFVEGMS
jgi:hypothetical protein